MNQCLSIGYLLKCLLLFGRIDFPPRGVGSVTVILVKNVCSDMHIMLNDSPVFNLRFRQNLVQEVFRKLIGGREI
jgi:hypothetical protein